LGDIYFSGKIAGFWAGYSGSGWSRRFVVAGLDISRDGVNPNYVFRITKCKKPVGNTVDLEAANWLNTIGASELAAVWTDPDFDPKEKAFYYARVIEIPTPRWVLYDKVRLGAKLPKGAKLIHQERAYTSPIWYTP